MSLEETSNEFEKDEELLVRNTKGIISLTCLIIGFGLFLYICIAWEKEFLDRAYYLMGVVGFIALIGSVLGIFGIRKKSQRGLAIAGLILNVLLLIAGIPIAVLVISFVSSW